MTLLWIYYLLYLHYFLGGKSDKEAFELALRRDRELQKRQLETMFQIREVNKTREGGIQSIS